MEERRWRRQPPRASGALWPTTLSPRGIRCNAICPGAAESFSLRDRIRAAGDDEASRKAVIARQPMGRLGTPEEIAALVVCLATATFTTGQTHVVAGGWAI